MRLLPLLLVACNAAVIDEYEICSIDLTLSPLAGAPGDQILATGTPFTELRDTRVQVGGVQATVTEVIRSDECALCDDCRDQAGCAPCGVCQGLVFDPSVRAECFGDPFSETAGYCASCVETMAFLVPDVPPGLTTLVVLNRNGQSQSVPFEVLPGAPDTGDTETGDTPDTGDTHTGDTETGDTPDTGDTETGDTPDTGDTETADTGDTETADTGTADTGDTDTGDTDTGDADTGDTETGDTGQ